MRTAPVAAASLVAGYAVARATGVRPLGGAVLVVGTAWCARRWASCGPGTAVALTGVQVAAFGASHRLARRIGAWPSVLVVAGASGLAAAVTADRCGGPQ